jgi:hypothetical protein
VTLEKFPSILAVATFIAISLVVSHEWGYFGIIGSDLQSLYTTYDYLAQLIVWLGPAFIVLAAIAGLQIFLLRTDNFQFNRRVPKTRWGKFLDTWYLEILYGISAVLALLLSNETARISLYLVGAIILSRVTTYVLSYEGFAEFRKTLGVLIVFIPAIMVAFYGVGRDTAYTDLRDTQNYYDLQLKEQHVIREIKVLRLLEKGALVFDPKTKLVEFDRYETIATLRRRAPTWETQSFVCRHWGWACPKPAP